MADVARFSYRHHLVRLIVRSEVAAARLADVDTDRLIPEARRASARWSARLDASPLTDETAAKVDADGIADRAEPDSARVSEGGSGWGAALKLDGMPTQDIAAREYANLLACHALEEELAPELFTTPLAVLSALYACLTDGLVDPARAGQLRQASQDVHDGAQGKVIYRTPPPEALPSLMDDLLSWIGHGTAGVPTLVVAGVVHGRLLEWQPFDAANGRLARVASRVVLRARGLDPAGVVVPERELAADPIGYFGEVAASIRRRGDLTQWLERTGEAVAAALETAVDVTRGEVLAVPERAVGVASTLAPGQAITLTEYADQAGVDRDTAASELELLRRRGLLVTDPGTQGLRLRRTAPPA